MARAGLSGVSFFSADMVLPLFAGNKKGAVAPGAGQERMNKGLNEQSADGADAKLVALLAAAALLAIIEVLTECVVGGALRTRPVPTLGKHLRHVGLGQLQLAPRRQVEVIFAVGSELDACQGSRMLLLTGDQRLSVGQAVRRAARVADFLAIAAEFQLAQVITSRDDQIVITASVDAAHQTGIYTAF